MGAITTIAEIIRKIQRVDLAKELESSGVLDKFFAAYKEYVGKLPEGVRPSPEVLDKLWAQAIASSPGAVREAIDKLQAQVINLLITRYSAIDKDDSALA